MIELTKVVGNTGGSIPLEHKGRVYNFHQWTDALRARYIQWAKSYAMQALRTLQREGVFTPAEYQEAFNGLRRDLVNGEYMFGKPALQSLIATPDGMHILVRVLLNDDSIQDDTIKDLIENRGAEVLAILEQLSGVKTEDEDDVDTSDPKAATRA